MAKIYCNNCGQLVPEHANFCQACGAPVRGAQAAAYRAEAPTLPQPTQPVPDVARIDHKRAIRNMNREVIERRHLAPRAVLLFFINYNFRMAIVFPGFAAGIYFEPLIALLLAAYFIVVWLIASLVYNHFYFAITQNRFEAEYGIIHKKHVSIPFEHVQNVYIKRTFIDRVLGIAKLEIESAGTASLKMRDVVGGTRSRSEGFLPGLSLEDARHIHDVLLVKKKYAHQNGAANGH